MYKSYFKRIFDFSFAFILLILCCPLLISLILILLFVNKGDVFFLQQRPGYQSIPFFIFKFKTMRDEFDSEGNPLPDHQRITKIGKLIRSLSLDELLQLINVIKGEMSLIGPRPLLMKYLPLYSIEQLRRHEAKPGITGLAQVKGRNGLSWEEKFNYDLFYVENLSFFLDLKIFILTIYHILFRKGINADEINTMPEFKGNK